MKEKRLFGILFSISLACVACLFVLHSQTDIYLLEANSGSASFINLQMPDLDIIEKLIDGLKRSF